MTPEIFIGWDSRASIACDVARNSILRRTNSPIKIIPLKLNHLRGILTRPIERQLVEGQAARLWCPISQAPMSTEFAISRFCVPLLGKGWALFIDCDVICWSDIDELFALADDRYAVMVVKHNQVGGTSSVSSKMDGQIQTYYARKNWSSVVLWNCDHEANKRFTIEHLNTWPGRDLHAFKWLSDSEIGSLPHHWNHLINVDPDPPTARAARTGLWHYTLGGPWFEGWNASTYDDAWLSERDTALSAKCCLA